MGKEKKQEPAPSAEKSFEQALADLELTVRQLEQGRFLGGIPKGAADPKILLPAAGGGRAED